MKNLIARLVSEEDGATMVEYALMVGLIAAVLVGIVGTLGGTLQGFFTQINSEVSSASGG